MKIKSLTIEELCNVEYGTRVTRKKNGGAIYPVYGGGGKTFFIDKKNRSNKVVIARFAMSEKCTRFVEGDFFLNDSGLTLSPKTNELSQEYLDKVILTLNNSIYELGKGAAQRNLDMKQFRLIKISYPTSITLQNKIVAKLDSMFAEIEKAIELVQKQLIETELLYKSKLKHYFKNSFETRQPLYKLCTITSSKRIMKKDYVEEGIPFLRTKEVKQLAHNQPITTKLFISKEQYCSLRDKFGAPKKDDILFTAIGTIGEVYIVKNNDEFYFKDGNILWLKDLINVSPDYLRYGLLSFVENINTLAHGAAYSALPIQRLKAFEIPIPSMKEQSDIVNRLENLFQQIKTLKSTLNSKLLAFTTLKSAILKKELQQNNSEAA